jgi:hypothetical protein
VSSSACGEIPPVPPLLDKGRDLPPYEKGKLLGIFRADPHGTHVTALSGDRYQRLRNLLHVESPLNRISLGSILLDPGLYLTCHFPINTKGAQ